VLVLVLEIARDLVLVLNEMVLVLVLEIARHLVLVLVLERLARSSSTSTSTAFG
jgi:hypothetical protein